ncbi:TetR/AcrR family transcriptional regulator [Streptomycetaceae bacterium NBC_01309]
MAESGVRRQARGERRMAEILDAAAGVLADVGYDAATTNAIAARAGVSPGSLYQFFRNKDAVVEALAQRFAAQMAAAHSHAFDPAAAARGGLGEMLDRVLDPLIAFNVANPGFKALFARIDVPPAAQEAVRPLQAGVVGRVEAILAARAPDAPAPERGLSARTCMQIVMAMMPLITAAPAGAEREVLVSELKTVLGRYLEPVYG